MIYKEFAQLIKAKRINKGISQKDFSKSIGIKQPKYSKIESGIQEPTFVELQIISKKLDIDLTKELKIKEPNISKFNFD